MSIYYRYQPAHSRLFGHRSDTSSGRLPPGFVFAYADIGEMLWGDWSPFAHAGNLRGAEIITFMGKDAFHPGDAEGVAVRPTRILVRETPISFLRRIERTAKNEDVRRAAREILDETRHRSLRARHRA